MCSGGLGQRCAWSHCQGEMGSCQTPQEEHEPGSGMVGSRVIPRVRHSRLFCHHPSSAAELAVVAGFGMHSLLFLHFLQRCVPGADGSSSLAGCSLCVRSSLSLRIKNAVED